MRIFLALLCAVSLRAEEKWFERLEYRFIGPALMGGRATDVEGVPGNPAVVYAATGTGGLWKTVNGGVTWNPIFERQDTISIGDIALESGNPDVIWLGSGESNVRNSVGFGDGVYRSTDGGKTWKHLGLRETERISRVIVHPANPNIVWVGALGHAFGPNEHRGVYLTTDGGATWSKTLYIDPSHGVADLDVDPVNPNIVYAAMWRFERKPWTHTSGSEQGGVFKSIDGGRTWKKLTDGLPKLMGRIGVKVAPSNPDVVYVAAESNDGILFRSSDKGEHFKAVYKKRDIVGRGFYYADLRVDPTDENRLYTLSTNLWTSIDGGATFKTIAGRIHSDHHALWIDPKDPRRLWLGQDGGFAVSLDRGASWEYVNNLALAQFYQIHADNREPFYMISGGLQDNGTWQGPSRTREPAGILNDDWRMISFGDGFHVTSHPNDPDVFLTESQGGYLSRMDMRTREQQLVSPQPKSNAGGTAASMKYRFNWNAPVIPSPHDGKVVYFGGNVLFKTTDFGKTWSPISPDLTTNDPEKQKSAGGPVWYDNSTAENHCTIISIAESPLKRDTVWVGTDDGNVQMTANGGKSWSLVKVAVPAHSPVSHVEPSRHDANLVYAAFDRHMFDDFAPHIFRSADGGKSWTRIVNGIGPKAYVHVVKEDPKNPQMLYAGTELGLYVSWDRGGSWQRLHLKNLPHVPVHDILVHPRENDLILGTHGRSVVIFDDAAPLQQMNASVAASGAHLFDVRPALRFTSRFTRYGLGNKVFAGPNPPAGALITYWLKEKGEVKMEILDAAGKAIRTLEKPSKEQGLQRVSWDLRSNAPVQRKERAPAEEEDDFAGPPRGPLVLPGTYTVRLTAAGQTIEKKVEVRLDPSLKIDPAELRSQFDTVQRLTEMQSAVNRALKSIDSLHEQIANSAKLAAGKSGWDELRKEIEKELDRVEDGLGQKPDAPRLESPPRLAENLRALAGGIDQVNAAATPYQMEVFNELRSD
ncbi:MAG: hypothetical protein MUC42_12155, partial [Bryobacter sp.]|nr:hypothetical protein [Bryobacter sp.]